MTDKNLFDQFGRLIPKTDDIVYAKESRRYFSLIQPEINYAQIHHNIKRYLSPDLSLSVTDFEMKAKQLIEQIKQNPELGNLARGIHIPFIYPRFHETMELDQELEELLLPAVGKSFKEKFPQYLFTNYCEGKLREQIDLIENVHYENLLKRRTKEVIVGWYFPNTLSEYSLPDQKKIMKRLPSSLMLSGGLEAACAFVGTPEILMKKDNVYPHLLCLSSMGSKQKAFFYFFEAYGWNLTFNTRSYIGAVSEYFAGGLSLI